MDNLDSIIHIGGNKTASTLLQRKLFSKYKNIFYVGEDCYKYKEIQDSIFSLVHEDDFYYDSEEFISLLNSIKKDSDASHFIFSNEDIMYSKNPTLCAQRLKEIIPNSKVLMVIRNQFDVIPSWYANHGAYLKNVPKKFWKRYVDLDSWLDYCFSFPDSSPLQAMDYYKYYQIFSRLFGKENIIVLAYEDILFDRSAFTHKLSTLIGVDASDIDAVFDIKSERPRNTQLQFLIHSNLGFSRRLSDLTYSFFSRFDNTQPVKIILNDYWKAKIFEHYAESNKLLALNVDIDLRNYNYPLN